MVLSFLFCLILSLDAFTSSIAYGISKIKIPFLSGIIISSMGVLFLGISFLISYFLKGIVNPTICIWISASILWILGCHNLFSSIIKRRLQNKQRNIQFNVSNIHIMIDIYVDETNADLDHSKILSSKEALLLGTALSIDSLATGFSIGLGDISYILCLLFTFLFTFIAIIFGSYLGRKLITKLDFSWISGLVLIILGILRFL